MSSTCQGSSPKKQRTGKTSSSLISSKCLLTNTRLLSPCRITCDSCNVEMVTFVQHEMNPFFPLAFLVILFVFGYLSIIIIPTLYLITQNAVHRCSRCLQTLGIKRCFGLPDDFNARVSFEEHLNSLSRYGISNLASVRSWWIGFTHSLSLAYSLHFPATTFTQSHTLSTTGSSSALSLKV